MAHFRKSRMRRSHLHDQIALSPVPRAEVNLPAHHLRAPIFASCAAHAESGSSLPCDQRKV